MSQCANHSARRNNVSAHPSSKKPALPVKKSHDLKKVVAVVALISVLLCASAVIYGSLDRSSESPIEDDPQTILLNEIDSKAGTYDDGSIVLYDTTYVKAHEIADKIGASVRMSPDNRFAAITLPDGVTVRDVVLDDSNYDYFKSMSLDYQVSASEVESGQRIPSAPTVIPSDGLFSYQSYYDYLNLKDTWNTTKGAGITVAVIDTGIDTDHPEFAGKISEYSYNATTDKIVKDYDWSVIEDVQGHGTSVAGVIAAAWDGTGTIGIAPDVTLLVIKAECNSDGEFLRTSDLVFGLYYAIEQDADVVNMSFGTLDYFNPFRAATQLAVDSDIICVAAAGNDSSPTLNYPAADPNVIGVGALDFNSWDLADYSNYGENVDVVAPGTTYTTKMGGGYGLSNGTSLASPVVAGMISLYLSLNPYQMFDDITEVLYASCYDLGDLGKDYYFGYGAVDVFAMLLEEKGTVTFDMLTDEVNDVEQLFVRNHTLQNIPEPKRLYSVFDGWYYDIQCTDVFHFYEDVFTSDLTLYAKWSNEDDAIPYTYVELEDGTIEIRSYTGHRNNISIPNYIDGKPVTSIGSHAFDKEIGLRQINLPENLTNISDNAFRDCINLIRMTIPEGVEKIGSFAFYGDVRLSSIIFEGSSSLEKIESFAFANCCKLQRFEIPGGVDVVDGSVFFGDTSLAHISVGPGNNSFVSIDGVLLDFDKNTIVAYPVSKASEYDIPDGVTVIGNHAFAFSKLSTINIEGVLSIENSAFKSSQLNHVDIADSVIDIGEGAFCDIISLQSVTIGNSVSRLPDNLFAFDLNLRSIEIPKNIIYIDGEAFKKSGLSNISFQEGSSLLSIGNYAFCETHLIQVELPKSLESIGVGAFECDVDLSAVLFQTNSNLKFIGSFAFAYTYSLKAVEFDTNLISLGDYAFKNSGVSGTVLIPSKLTDFGVGVFASCSKLKSFEVAEDNIAYKSISGVLYSKDGSTIVEYPAGRESDTYYVEFGTEIVRNSAFWGSFNLCQIILPDTLTTLEEYAVYLVLNLTSIDIPDSVMQIGRYAFSNDLHLESVNFNETSILPRISFGAFAYSGITSFTVPASVSTMAQKVFEGCNKLESVAFAKGSKLPYVAAYMFDGCSSLKSISFLEGSSLNQIQAHGLEGMSQLTDVDFGDAKLEKIGNYAFRFCKSLSEIELPSTVTYIGRFAFFNCTALEELTLPEGIDYVGSCAFHGTGDINIYFESDRLPDHLQENWDSGVCGYYTGVCSVTTDGDWRYAILSGGSVAIIDYSGSDNYIDLTSLGFGSISVIGVSSFAYSSVEEIILPDTLVNVQRKAFEHSSLMSVVIPVNVSFIGSEAFAYTPLTSIIFEDGSSLDIIEKMAFYHTESLESITIPASVSSMGTSVFAYSGLESLLFESGIGLLELPDMGFQYSHLTSVTIPDSVVSIGDYSFNGISSLEAVMLPSVYDLHIGGYAFYGSGLKTVCIPANVTYIGEYAFIGLYNLMMFEVSEENQYYSTIDGLLTDKSGRKLIAVPAGMVGSLMIPDTIEIIGFGAFENSRLSEVVFAENSNVLTLGYRAFFNADYITSITIPASVISIDFYAFALCDNLAEVNFDKGCRLTGIYEGAFYLCGNLSNIVLPDSIIDISDFAFYGCSKLTAIPISEDCSLESIGSYSFAYLGISGEFSIPETVVDIGDYAFIGISATSVSIPVASSSDLIIGLGAFEDCNELEEITLPFVGSAGYLSNATWFGYIFGAGSPDSNLYYVPETLKKVTLLDGVNRLDTKAFYGCEYLETLIIPNSLCELGHSVFTGTNVRYCIPGEVTIGNDITCDTYGGYATSPFGKGLSGTLNIAYGIDEISSSLFYDCPNLSKVVIPNSVHKICADAFGKGITYLELPASLTTIEGHFDDYYLSVIYNNSSLDIPLLDGYDEKYTIYGPSGEVVYSWGSVPFEVIETDDGFIFTKCGENYTLRGYCGTCSEITLPTDINGNDYSIWCFVSGFSKCISIPFGFKEISEDSFIGCDVETVLLPSSIVSIGGGAFAGSKIRYMELPSSLLIVGSGAFYGCDNLQYLKIPAGAFGSLSYHTQVIESDKMVIDILDCGECHYEGGVLYNSDYTEVLYINSNYATDVFIRDSVKRLPSNVLFGSSIKSIHISNGLEYLSYSENYSLKSIYYDGTLEDWITKIRVDGNLNRTDCIDLFISGNIVKDVTIPEGMASIGPSAFENISLTSVCSESPLIYFGDRCFAGCVYLESIDLSEAIHIGSRAFEGCSSLGNLVISDSLKTMGQCAFSGISAEYLQIPANT